MAKCGYCVYVCEIIFSYIIITIWYRDACIIEYCYCVFSQLFLCTSPQHHTIVLPIDYLYGMGYCLRLNVQTYWTLQAKQN